MSGSQRVLSLLGSFRSRLSSAERTLITEESRIVDRTLSLVKEKPQMGQTEEMFWNLDQLCFVLRTLLRFSSVLVHCCRILHVVICAGVRFSCNFPNNGIRFRLFRRPYGVIYVSSLSSSWTLPTPTPRKTWLSDGYLIVTWSRDGALGLYTEWGYRPTCLQASQWQTGNEITALKHGNWILLVLRCHWWETPTKMQRVWWWQVVEKSPLSR